MNTALTEGLETVLAAAMPFLVLLFIFLLWQKIRPREGADASPSKVRIQDICSRCHSVKIDGQWLIPQEGWTLHTLRDAGSVDYLCERCSEKFYNNVIESDRRRLAAQLGPDQKIKPVKPEQPGKKEGENGR